MTNTGHRRGPRGQGRRPGRPGRPGRGWRGTESRTTAAERSRVRAWVVGRVPDAWQVDATAIRVDDDEVLVVVHLAEVPLAPEAEAEERATAESARISGFREETRSRRMQIAEEGEAVLGRTVSWGATCGETTVRFTTASIPVMTRLRIDERQILDTLVDAGVARSRSDALAWCVRLVGTNEERWISELREAFTRVEEVRARGPESSGTP